MENLEKFEWLLEKRSYSELTEEERQWVKNFVSSEFEYESLRKVNSHLDNYFSDKDKIVPSSKVWRAIKSHITLAKRSSEKSYWIAAPMPAYATLILLIVVCASSWYGGARYSSPIVTTRQILQRVDTVFITSKPDTVIRERIIYLKANSAPASLQVSNKYTEDVSPKKGVNMKEKENLEELLVSGSR